jgi:hypothetical protein
VRPLPQRTPSLTVAEVVGTLHEIAAAGGSGSQGRKLDLLTAANRERTFARQTIIVSPTSWASSSCSARSAGRVVGRRLPPTIDGHLVVRVLRRHRLLDRA